VEIEFVAPLDDTPSLLIDDDNWSACYELSGDQVRNLGEACTTWLKSQGIFPE
jgi:hypothetical protein